MKGAVVHKTRFHAPHCSWPDRETRLPTHMDSPTQSENSCIIEHIVSDSDDSRMRAFV